MPNSTTVLDSTLKRQSELDNFDIIQARLIFDSSPTTPFEFIAGITGKQICIDRIQVWGRTGAGVIWIEQNSEVVGFLHSIVNEITTFDFTNMPIILDSGEGMDLHAQGAVSDVEFIIWYHTKDD